MPSGLHCLVLDNSGGKAAETGLLLKLKDYIKNVICSHTVNCGAIWESGVNPNAETFILATTLDLK